MHYGGGACEIMQMGEGLVKSCTMGEGLVNDVHLILLLLSLLCHV